MDNSAIQPKNYEVYMHLNTLNGKGYVGITCRGVRNRLYSHESEARHGSNKPFARAIRKYGLAAFETRVLAQGLTRDQAIEAEKQFVAEFETFGPRGYNATAGGDGEWAGISATALSVAIKKRRPIAKQGPLFGCLISKLEGNRNGWTT